MKYVKLNFFSLVASPFQLIGIGLDLHSIQEGEVGLLPEISFLPKPLWHVNPTYQHFT